MTTTTRTETTMKAIVANRYGGPEVLEETELATPEVGDDQVLVAVKAVGLNAADWHYLRGEPYLARLSFGLRKPKRPIQGIDIAGVVEQVGSEVTRFQPGDEVYGETGGGLAEFVATSEKNLAIKPSNSSFEEAAAIPIAGLTALQGLRDHGSMEAGDKVLINGASGGVGTFAVQIAKAMGGHVTAVCSTRNVEQARALGADEVIDYTKEDFAQRSDRYDVILEIVGDRKRTQMRKLLTTDGTCVMIGAKGMGNWIAPLTYMAKNALTSQVTGMLAKATPEDLKVLADMIEVGDLTPAVEKAYPMSEVAAAMAHVDDGHARGKVVVTI